MDVRSFVYYAGLLTIVIAVMSIPIYSIISPTGPDVSESFTVSVYNYTKCYEVEVEEHHPFLPQVRCGLNVHAYRFVEPDDCIRDLAEQIRTETGLEGSELVEFILRTVNCSIEYRSDKDAHGWGDWWQYPCETLALGTGDCEDKAFLFIALCKALGFECIIVDEPGHVSAGVLVDCPGEKIVYHGKEYVTADPTKEHYLGVVLPEIECIWPDHIDSAQMHFIILDVLFMLVIAASFMRWALS